MDRFSSYILPLLLLTTAIIADGNDSSIDEHRVPRVSGRIVKVYSGNRPEPYLCNSEGYKADPHACASFYRCVQERNGKFNVFRYQCAPGTVYDPDLETCNHPRSTRRAECGGMLGIAPTTESTLVNDIEQQKELPRPINTNKSAFTKETTAKESLVTRRPIASTVYQSPNTLAAYISDATNDKQGYNFATLENTAWTTDKTEYIWYKTTSLPKVVSNSKNDDICSDDGFTGDTENCRKFYRCIGNQRGGFLRYEFFCSESTIWDEQIQSCNHPWAVKRSKCGRSMAIINTFLTTKPSTPSSTLSSSYIVQETTPSPSEFGKKTKTIQQQLQISHGSKVTQTQTQISHSDQVVQNQTQINYSDNTTQNEATETKQNQTQIAHGSAVSQTQTQIDYGSKGMQTQLQIDHSKDSSQSQAQIHESTTSHTTTSNQNNQCSESGFMGDSNDCKKFYRCVDNGRGYTRYEYKCGEGTVWDQSIEACNHAWAVKNCGGQSSSDSQPSHTTESTTYRDETTTTQTPTQSSSEASEPDIDDIDVGYGNQLQSETTTKSSTTKKEPQYETTNQPQNKPGNNNQCKSSGFMGDTDSCKKFYRCVDNGMGGYTKYEFTCGEGTVWDSSLDACNHAWAVKSCGGSGGPSQGSSTSESTSTTINVEITTTAAPVDENTDEPTTRTTTVGFTSTTAQDTGSNTDNKCKQSGFMGDNQNCKKFYRCVDNGDGTYTRHEFTCGEGTVWDSRIDACNHEWAVEKCGGNSESTTIVDSSTAKQPILQDEDKENEPTTENIKSSSTTQHSTTTVTNEVQNSDQACTGSGFVGDKNDCKLFYRCVDNGNGGYDRYQFSCGEGTVWDGSISACNHAWAVKECGLSGGYASQSSSESSLGSTASTTETDNESKEPPQQTTEKSTSTTGHPSDNQVREEDCESEGFFGSLIDCKRFIRCVDDGNGGFTKYEFTCSEGTTWNQNIAACDHPSPDRPCGQNQQSTTQGSHVNDEVITETTTKRDSLTTSPDQESNETQKPQQSTSSKCESEGFYGDPSDCKKFYRCVDDGKGGYTKYDFVCGDGTVWNQEIVACDHESDDKSCLGTVPRPTEGGSSQSQGTTSEPSSESTTSSTSANNEGVDKTEPPSSNDECTSEGFFPHSNDCKKFVRCVDNGDGGYTRYEFSCGQGTVWVQEIQTCDHDNGDSTCSQQSDTSTKPQNSGGSSSSTPEGTSSVTESQTQNKEDDEYPTTKQPSNAESDKCTSEGYFGNKNDCRKFYRCVDNDGSFTKYDFDCGEGTAWDSSVDTCNHINEVESCSENNKEETQTQQTMKDEEVSQTTEGSSNTTNESSSSSSSEMSEKPSSGSNAGSDDKCESEGYYGDSKDCKKFYRCVDDGKGGLTKYDFICGEGTIWDQDITNCNHPQDVNNPSCKSGEGAGGDDQSSATDSSTSSTTSSPESTSSSSTSDNSTQSSSNCSQEETSKKPASSKDITCDKAGYYPNPNDCKKFYRCVDWDGDGKRFSVYHFECGEGTIWDPALDTCNHEESVYPPRDCSQTQSQSETSSEGTTQKQEETTTQESTTSEQTTTQQSTTSEKTTTEQEQTTTQQSTSSEQTTTQESTTAEQTTTQQSTTSEKTTTQKSTTSEQTTTQQTTTSQQTTTQQITTTTQASTTAEQTTTQESTTAEETPTTTQESTTAEQTTAQSSNEQTTTQESTTSEQTTQENTAIEPTTQESTTNEQTTEQTTTQESSTDDQSTTEKTESSNTEETTESSTTEADNSSTTEESSTESSSSDKECPETEDDQYLLVCPTSFKRHPKYCNMFYQCIEDDDTHEVKIATFKCPNETIYDENQTQCVEQDKADEKCDGEMARRHRFKRLHRDSKEPITADKEKKSCPTVGYYAFEKNVECSSGFLKCESSKTGKIRGYVNQCPEGFLFWAISKRCELARNVRDCKRSSNDWSGRWNIPVDRKNIAF